MPLTSREAFKVGFMLRCADEGLSPEEAQLRIEKAASALSKPVWGGVGDFLSGGLRGLTTLGTFLPIAGGALGGYLLAKGKEEPVDEEDVKRQELINEYKRLTRAARQQARLKLLRDRALV